MGPLVVLYDGRTASTGTPSVTLNSPADAGTASSTPTLDFTGVTSTGDQNISYEVQIDTLTTFDSNSPTPAFVQSATPGTNPTGSTSTTSAGAFASANTVHNAIIAGAVVDSTSAATNVTDTAGNIYTLQAKYPASGNRYLEIWACFDIKAQASNVVSYTQGFNDGAVFAHEYSNLYGIVDQTASGTSTNAAPTATTAATTYSHQLVFSIMEMDVFSSDVINSAGTGYTNFQTGSSNNILGAVESKIVTTTGAQTATFNVTNAGGASWRLLVATFPAIAPLIDASSNVNVGFADVTNGAKTDPFPSSDQIGYTVQSALTAGTLYYWRVKEIRPTNNVNYLAGWSATHSFTVASGTVHTSSLAAGLSFTGAQVKQDIKGLTGGLSFVGAINKVITYPLTAVLSFAGNLSRKLSRNLAAVLSFTGSFVASHLFVKAFTATLSFTGSINRRTTRGLSAVLSFTGTLSRIIARNLIAGLSFTGALAKKVVRSLVASLSFVGAILTGTLHHLTFTAILGFTGALSKSINRPLAATLSFTGSISRAVKKTLAATVSFVGNVAKASQRGFSAALNFTGGIVTAIVSHFHFINLSSSLSFSGSLSKTTSKSIVASLSFIGNMITSLAPRYMISMITTVLGGKNTSDISEGNSSTSANSGVVSSSVSQGKQFTDVSTSDTLESVNSGSANETASGGTTNTEVKSSNQ